MPGFHVIVEKSKIHGVVSLAEVAQLTRIKKKNKILIQFWIMLF